MTAFHYAIGRNRFDAQPVAHAAASLRDFAADLLARRAPSKDRAGYVAAVRGRRCKDNAIPRNWLAIDADGIDPEVLPDWRMHLARWRGFGWPTASSAPEAPRERVILELSESVDRDQGIGIGALVTADFDAEFGAAVRVDPCTYRAEQPCFLPVGDVQPFYLLGDPLDVPVWLAQVPPPRPAPPPLSADAAGMADVRVRAAVDLLGQAGLLTMPLPNQRGYAMRCPWERQHTSYDPPGSSATALLFPAEPNGWRGGFKCLHAHCAHRGLRDLLGVLQAARLQSQERQAA